MTGWRRVANWWRVGCYFVAILSVTLAVGPVVLATRRWLSPFHAALSVAGTVLWVAGGYVLL